MADFAYTMENRNELMAELHEGGIFRVRIRKEGDHPSGLSRYGFILPRPAAAFETEEDDGMVAFKTPLATLRLSKKDGAFTLEKPDGRILVRTIGAPKNTRGGFDVSLALQEGERFYGMGDVTRDQIEKRGYKREMWVENVKSYVPIPVLLSSMGWGVFLNTTWRHTMDVGASREDCLRFFGSGGELDMYFFVGDDYRALLGSYTDLLGKPSLLPMWAYGLVYVCNQEVDARAMMDECMSFRREGIPCDVCGLEPGWMSEYYDFSTDKKWHPERFYIPYWSPKGDQTFFGALDRQGFKLSLWLCCDYDLSFEEERAFGTARAALPPSERTEDDFEQDMHFQQGPLSMDRITKVDEPWFEHLKKFVDQGARCFKLDGARQIENHPDRKWGNGMDDEEMHNLYPAIYNKQMSGGFEDYTGLRSMIYSAGGYAGIQRHSATWAGDTGGGPKPLVSMLNHGFSGHSNTSCDMDVFSAEGIHFGFFQTWSQLCNWAYWRQPWYLTDDRKAMYRFYARLRYRMLPYIYTAAYEASMTGYPVMRAMAMAYPQMPGVDGLLYQYMFGDDLLTGAFLQEIVLPQGAWIDAWTHRPVEGGKTYEVQHPPAVGGPLYIREGAVIPSMDETPYIGYRPMEHVTFSIYPAQDRRAYTLYEDDGETRRNLKGEFATTQVSHMREGDTVRVEIGPRQGSYEGMPSRRRYTVDLPMLPSAQRVLCNGREVGFEVVKDAWCGEVGSGFVRIDMEPSQDALSLEIYAGAGS